MARWKYWTTNIYDVCLYTRYYWFIRRKSNPLVENVKSSCISFFKMYLLKLHHHNTYGTFLSKGFCHKWFSSIWHPMGRKSNQFLLKTFVYRFSICWRTRPVHVNRFYNNMIDCMNISLLPDSFTARVKLDLIKLQIKDNFLHSSVVRSLQINIYVQYGRFVVL